MSLSAQKRVVALVAAGLWLLSMGAALGEEKPLSRDFMPLVTLSGAHSRIAEKSLRVVTHEADWYALWCRHVGAPVREVYDSDYNPAGAPTVDFGRCMVVAVFQGKSWNSAGVKAVSVKEEEDVLRFRFDDRSYQTMNGGDEVTAFGFFVVPRTRKPVVLEENVQGLLGKPPVWKERARLAPGKRSMKGWELYGWRASDGTWRYSLLAGTNRLKTYEEVTGADASLKGVEALEKALDGLAEGQAVIWFHGRVKVPEGKATLAFPPADEVRRIADR